MADKQLEQNMNNYFEKAIHNKNNINSFKKDVVGLNVKDLLMDKINQAADVFLTKMESKNNK